MLVLQTQSSVICGSRMATPSSSDRHSSSSGLAVNLQGPFHSATTTAPAARSSSEAGNIAREYSSVQQRLHGGQQQIIDPWGCPVPLPPVTTNQSAWDSGHISTSNNLTNGRGLPSAGSSREYAVVFRGRALPSSTGGVMNMDVAAGISGGGGLLSGRELLRQQELANLMAADSLGMANGTRPLFRGADSATMLSAGDHGQENEVSGVIFRPSSSSSLFRGDGAARPTDLLLQRNRAGLGEDDGGNVYSHLKAVQSSSHGAQMTAAIGGPAALAAARLFGGSSFPSSRGSLLDSVAAQVGQHERRLGNQVSPFNTTSPSTQSPSMDLQATQAPSSSSPMSDSQALDLQQRSTLLSLMQQQQNLDATLRLKSEGPETLSLWSGQLRPPGDFARRDDAGSDLQSSQSDKAAFIQLGTSARNKRQFEADEARSGATSLSLQGGDWSTFEGRTMKQQRLLHSNQPMSSGIIDANLPPLKEPSSFNQSEGPSPENEDHHLGSMWGSNRFQRSLAEAEADEAEGRNERTLMKADPGQASEFRFFSSDWGREGDGTGSGNDGAGTEEEEIDFFREAMKPRRPGPPRKDGPVSQPCAAARNRRERLAQHVRTLQTLVPGCAKMDASKVLERTIHHLQAIHKELQDVRQALKDEQRGRKGRQEDFEGGESA